MKFYEDAGRLGFRLELAERKDFGVFQVAIDGQWYGDDEPFPVWSLMNTFGMLPTLEEKIFDPSIFPPAQSLKAIIEDEQKNDDSLVWSAESLDHVVLKAYFFGDSVIVVAAKFDLEDSRIIDVTSSRRCVVPRKAFEDLALAMRLYWSTKRERQIPWVVT